MAKFVDEITASGPEGSGPSNQGRESLRSQRANTLMRRYLDAYRVAALLDGLGKAFKVIGLILGAIGVIAGFLMVADASAPVGVVLISAGIFFGAFGFLAGVMISSIGQMQKATLDNAVNTSTFLNDDERAVILSLD